MGFVYKSLEKHLEGLRDEYVGAVDEIIRDATEESEDGAYTINFDNIPGDFDMPEDRYLFSEMLAERDEVIEAEAHGYGIDLKLNPQYCQRMTVDPESIPESHLHSPYAIDLIATYEKLLPVREQERVTDYWGDYGGYVEVHGITDEQLRLAYAEALQAINMSSEAYHDRKFINHDEVETYMQGCMLARILEPGDEIVYVPPSPTGEVGQWQYEAGRVVETHSDTKCCVVSFEDCVVTIPFRYVLARFRNDAYDGNAFGFEHAEPVFGITENKADHCLWEAKQEYDQQHLDETETSGEDEDQGMTMQ
jgi:hypothetical protein